MEDFVDHPRSSLRDKIPVRPPKPVPLEDVPMWKTLAYDTKYPLSEYSKKYASLTTEEIGKSLYQSFPSKEFDLSQSPIPFLDASYNSLHDPHLRTYFRSPMRYKCLIEKGLVTEDGKVKALLQEYNQYRMYLYHLWALQVNQLVQTQMKTERSCFESMLRALDSEDTLFRDVAEKYNEINAEEILEEVAMKLFQSNKIIGEHGFSPFIRSVIQWKIYQEKLKNDFKNNYPVVQQWLSEQNKHYKRLMDKKITDRRDHDVKLRNRWEKLCENSQARLEKELTLKDAVKKMKKNLVQQRYNKVKSLWAKDEQELLQRKNASKSAGDFLAPSVMDSEKWRKYISQAISPNEDRIKESSPTNEAERDSFLTRSDPENSEDTFLSLSSSRLTDETELDMSSEISKTFDDDAVIKSSDAGLQTDDGSETSKNCESKAYSEATRDKRKLDILENDSFALKTKKSSESQPRKKINSEKNRETGSIKEIPYKHTSDEGSLVSLGFVTDSLDKRTSDKGYDLLKIKPETNKSKQVETIVSDEMLSEDEILLKDTSRSVAEKDIKAKQDVWKKINSGSKSFDKNKRVKSSRGVTDKPKKKLITEKDQDPYTLSGSVEDIPHKRTSDEGSLVSADSITDILDKPTSEGYHLLKIKPEANKSKLVETIVSDEMLSEDEILFKDTSRSIAEEDIKAKKDVWKKINSGSKSFNKSKRTKNSRGITDKPKKKLITEKDQDPYTLSASVEDIPYKRTSDEGSLVSADSIPDILDKPTSEGYNLLKIKPEANKSGQVKTTVSGERMSEDKIFLKGSSRSTSDDEIQKKKDAWKKVDAGSKLLDQSKKTKSTRSITRKSKKELIKQKDQEPNIMSGSVKDISHNLTGDEGSLVSSDPATEILDKPTREEGYDLLKIKPETNKNKQVETTISGEMISEDKFGTSRSTSDDEIKEKKDVCKKVEAVSKLLDRSKETKGTEFITNKPKKKLIMGKHQNPHNLPGSAEDISHKRTNEEGSPVLSDSIRDILDKRTSEEEYGLLKFKPETNMSKQAKTTVSDEMIWEDEISLKGSNRSTSEDRVKATSTIDEPQTHDNKISKTASDSTPYLRRVLGAYGYREYSDIWKALENSINDKKMKFLEANGLTYQKTNEYRSERIRKEFRESNMFSSPTNSSLSEKHPIITTNILKEENFKRYKTDSSESESESKEEILHRISGKKTVRKQSDDTFIRNDFPFKARREFEKNKSESSMKQDYSEARWKSNLKMKENLQSGSVKSDVHRCRKNNFDSKFFDLSFSGKRPYFGMFSDRENQSRIIFKKSIQYKKIASEKPPSIYSDMKSIRMKDYRYMLLPDPIVSKSNKNINFSFPYPRPIKPKDAFSEDDKITAENLIDEVSLTAERGTERGGEAESENAITNLLQQNISESEVKHDISTKMASASKEKYLKIDEGEICILIEDIISDVEILKVKEKKETLNHDDTTLNGDRYKLGFDKKIDYDTKEKVTIPEAEENNVHKEFKEVESDELKDASDRKQITVTPDVIQDSVTKCVNGIALENSAKQEKCDNGIDISTRFEEDDSELHLTESEVKGIETSSKHADFTNEKYVSPLTSEIDVTDDKQVKFAKDEVISSEIIKINNSHVAKMYKDFESEDIINFKAHMDHNSLQDKQLKNEEMLSDQTEEFDKNNATGGISKSSREIPSTSKKSKNDSYADIHFTETDSNYNDDIEATLAKLLYESIEEMSKRKIKGSHPFLMPEMTEDKDLILPSDVKVAEASEESIHLVNFQPTKEIPGNSESSYYGKKEDIKSKYDLAITASIEDGSIGKVMEDENAAKEKDILLNINVDKVKLSMREPSTLPDSVGTSFYRAQEKHENYYKIRTDTTIQDQSKLKDDTNVKSPYFELPQSSSIADSVPIFASSKEIRHHEDAWNADNEFQRLKSHLTPPSLKDMVIKNLKSSQSYNSRNDVTSEHFSDKNDLLKGEYLSEILSPDDIVSAVKLDLQNISEVRAQKINLERATFGPLHTKYRFLSERKSPTRHLTLHATDSSTLTVVTEKSNPDIKSSLQRTQIISHNKNISLDLDGPFPGGKNDFMIDFSKIKSVSIKFKFPESLINKNLNEENVKMFLTQWTSNIMQRVVKCTHFISPDKSSLEVLETDVPNIHDFQENKSKSILNSKHKTVKERDSEKEDMDKNISESDALQNEEDNDKHMFKSDALQNEEENDEHMFKSEALQNEEDNEEYMFESDALQNEEDNEEYMFESDALQNEEDNEDYMFESDALRNEEYMSESDAFESDSHILESNEAVPNQNEKSKIYSSVTSDTSNAQVPNITIQEISPTLSIQGPSFKVANAKQDKPDVSQTQKDSITKTKNLFTKRKDRRTRNRSERSSAKNADIIITEDIKSFSGYPTRENMYNKQATTQLSHATHINEAEGQQRGSRSYSKIDLDEYQEKSSGTERYSSRFKDLPKYISIINIADERAQCLEDHFKTNKIRSKFTNVEDVIIADKMEHGITIVENKVSKFNKE